MAFAGVLVGFQAIKVLLLWFLCFYSVSRVVLSLLSIFHNVTFSASNFLLNWFFFAHYSEMNHSVIHGICITYAFSFSNSTSTSGYQVKLMWDLKMDPRSHNFILQTFSLWNSLSSDMISVKNIWKVHNNIFVKRAGKIVLVLTFYMLVPKLHSLNEHKRCSLWML